MAEFIARWFTPSQATGVSGAQFNAQYNAQTARRPAEVKQEEAVAKRPKKRAITKFGGASDQPSMLNDQADIARKTLLGQ